MRDLADRPPTAFFHGTGPVWEKGQLGRMDCLNLLLAILTERGFAVDWVPYADGIEDTARADPRHLHVVLDDRPLDAPNIVFCIPAYLRGFWYFDRMGTRNNSSLRHRAFHPEKMSARFAETFAATLRARFVEANFSKFEQELVPGFSPDPGAICLFAQEFRAPTLYPHYMSYPELIEAVIAKRSGRRVHIKPHPRQPEEEVRHLMRYHDPDAGVVVTRHSIHGLLAQAGVAVSISSAVLLEAQMHGVPGVVGGQVDFHHNMVTVRSPGEVGKAIDAAVNGRFAYDKYLTFFFAQGLIQPRLARKATERMGEVLTGMGFERAG